MSSSEPRQDAHQDEPTEYYDNQPQDDAGSGSGKVGDKDKGPSGKRGKKTDPRPGGKRHELADFFEGILTQAIEHIRQLGPTGLTEMVFGPVDEELCQQNESISPINDS